MPASPSCSATTSSSRSARSSSASTFRAMCGRIGRCDASCRVGKGALAPCPPLLFRACEMVGTLRFAHPTHCGSHLLQCPDKILDQIIDMFEPGGEADKTFADAEFGTGFRGQALMRRRCRMGHEALGIAE